MPSSPCFPWQHEAFPPHPAALVRRVRYNVLDAARPLLTTHRWLPRPVFRLALPLICRVKRLRDGFFAAQDARASRRTAEAAAAGGTA